MTSQTLAPAPVAAFLAPFEAISALAAEKASKFADIQLAALETYLAVGINQCRAAAAVHRPEDFKALADQQAELFKLLNEKALVDLQQLVLLGNEFSAGVQDAVLAGSKPAASQAN